MRPVHTIVAAALTARRRPGGGDWSPPSWSRWWWSFGLIGLQAAPVQAATYSNSCCGNTSGRVLLTFDDWAYGDPYRATRIGASLQSRNIRAAFFLINKYAHLRDGPLAAG